MVQVHAKHAEEQGQVKQKTENAMRVTEPETGNAQPAKAKEDIIYNIIPKLI